MKISKILKACRVDRAEEFRLAEHDPAQTFGLALDADDVRAVLADGLERLTALQDVLYAQDRWAVLIVLQGMDAAGKDSVVKHVISGVNPQGCEVHGFKQPSDEELQHDYLWRAATHLPARGKIGIFNRSYYEEVLVVRVHRELLDRQKLPMSLVGRDIWQHRFKEIVAFERHLVRNGTLILKFHLRTSKEEQRKRFLARLEEPGKRWKFSMADVAERKRWDDYMAAYEDMIRATSTPEAPWYVIPADHKHVAWMVVAEAVIDALARLRLEYPEIRGKALDELKKVERALREEKPEKISKTGTVA